MSTDLTLNPRIAQWATEAFARLLATYAIVTGIFVAVSDESRFSAAQYDDVLALPGFPVGWGVALFLAGAVMLVSSLQGRLRPVAIGGYVAAAWELFYSIAVLRSVLRNMEASLVPAIIHASVAVGFALVAVVYMQSRSRA